MTPPLLLVIQFELKGGLDESTPCICSWFSGNGNCRFPGNRRTSDSYIRYPGSCSWFSDSSRFTGNIRSSGDRNRNFQRTIVLRCAGYLAKFLRKISTLLYVWYICKYAGKMCSNLKKMKRNSYSVTILRHTTINTLRTKRQMMLPQSCRGDLSCCRTRHRVEVGCSVGCHATSDR